MKNVLIATPSYDGRLDVWYTNALLETVIAGFDNDIYFKPIFMSYDALIQRSRNDLLAIAKENEFDGILWIDSDIEWAANWAIELVNSGKDVIGLPCIKKSIAEQYNVKCKPEDLIKDEDGLIKVESVGTGFLYMSKEAIDYLWETSTPYIHNEQERRWVFEVKIQDNDIISEDVLLCQKLEKFGVYINPVYTCNHVGALKFQGDFNSFIERLTNP